MNALSNAAGIIVAIIGLALLAILPVLIIVFSIYCKWTIFKKMGESGWICLIPLYSTWILYKHIVGSGWKMFLLFVPIFNIIYAFYVKNNMFKKFGFSTISSIVFTFFPLAGIPIAAFEGQWSE